MLSVAASHIILLALLCFAVALLIVLLIRSFKASDNTALDGLLQLRFDEFIRRIAELEEQLAKLQLAQQAAAGTLREQLGLGLAEHNTRFEKRQSEALRQLAELLQTGMTQTQQQVGDYLARNSAELGKRMDALTQKTEVRLGEISAGVERRLTDGFEKTNATFADILKRLALIDAAQQKITELSSNVVSLQELLADKRSRGALGEVQLASLVDNILPKAHYQLQYTLPNGKIADCMLFLPPPTGMLAIDAKFPLESYRLMTDVQLPDSERRRAAAQFKTDMQRHITAIATRYIIPGSTSDGALMFIPAEAIFAEIQAHHPDVVERAHRARVWMVSPTTLWAVLNTARSVLKDAATREQVHLIQEHLRYLAGDFGRFEERMGALAKHIRQAHEDVDKVSISARKISDRFVKIEQVELQQDEAQAALDGSGEDKESPRLPGS